MRRGTGSDPAAETEAPHTPSPYDLADRPGSFALTVNVHDPEPVEEPVPAEQLPVSLQAGDETSSERGLRGLVGGGSSQVSVTAAMRARDAARPTEEDIATAETDLVIVRRGWVPRDDLPRSGRR
jgi:hypothetical protein